mmetsp:Transcript_44395/g.96463  ORF Transcript_44395/g.96463 Transcript_44395/m.96463 type:complete len:514 (-) Transcript_44395:123-1664(-)|eukprot:CAMPEP_0170571080 /NCGR_PEP_ID=MMETSP0224-20130122/1467_1 /TAXON_ID=285029 /ORGANISM="Togula jolla, Strain CCCM 725" /LENGTH=513 /DNA_ID=CAMNT_0010893429 /DNA_START=9 /DNA_END=1550 /DNA_ORIENTATION=+
MTRGMFCGCFGKTATPIEKIEQIEQKRSHVVFINVADTGHMNPTLPLVMELTRRGCLVTYIVHEDMRTMVEGAGAKWQPFRYPDSDYSGTLSILDKAAIARWVPEGTDENEYSGPPNGYVANAEQYVPALVEDLDCLTPPASVIVYEPFLCGALVAAHAVKVPAVALLTQPGPGVLADLALATLDVESKPWVRGPADAMAKAYGLDVLTHGMIYQFYSPTLNLVSAAQELFLAPVTEAQKQRFGGYPFKCVGAMVDPTVKRTCNSNVTPEKVKASMEGTHRDPDYYSISIPAKRLEEAMASGKRVIYISLGTVASSKDAVWKNPLHSLARGNDEGKSADGRTLADFSGRDICQFIWTACLEAFGNDDALHVVMVTGPQSDALEGLPDIPANFDLRQALPQLEMLPKCDLMVTHGGSNSIHEALYYGIPLVVVPIFGDQPVNADAVERTSAGVSFRHPLKSLTSAALREATRKMLEEEGDNSHRSSAKALAESLKAAGGASAAATAILDSARLN